MQMPSAECAASVPLDGGGDEGGGVVGVLTGAGVCCSCWARFCAASSARCRRWAAARALAAAARVASRAEVLCIVAARWLVTSGRLAGTVTAGGWDSARSGAAWAGPLPGRNTKAAAIPARAAAAMDGPANLLAGDFGLACRAASGITLQTSRLRVRPARACPRSGPDGPGDACPAATYRERSGDVAKPGKRPAGAQPPLAGRPLPND